MFSQKEHADLTEAALCLLELSYYRAGDLGQLAGAPHVLLSKMPPSQSHWRAWSLLIDADAMAAQGRYDEAQANLDQIFDKFASHPSVPSAKMLQAWTYAQLGDYDRAIALEEEVLDSGAENVGGQTLAAAQLHIANVRFNQHEFEEAAQRYEEFLAANPEDESASMALYQAGLCYLRLDRAGDAVDRWESLLATDPTGEVAEKAWVRTGDLYFNAHQYQDAKRCYRGYLDHFGGAITSSAVHLKLAQCDYNSGDYAGALELYSTLIETYPMSPEAGDAEAGMESSLYQLGQTEGGENVLAELVEKHPTSSFAADAQFQIALARYEAGEHAVAAEAFRRVVSQFSDYASADRAQFLAADSYEQLGDTDAATRSYEQFLMFFPDSELRRTVRFRLGSMHFAAADYMRAGIEFSGVLEDETVDDLTSAAQFNLALCRQQLGQNAQAVADMLEYRKRFGEDKRATDIAIALADAYDQAGDTANAVAEFERALPLVSDDAQRLEIRYRMGLCHEAQGSSIEAVAVYEKAMASKDRSNPFRLSAVARLAAIHEDLEQYGRALAAYRDLARHSGDPRSSTRRNCGLPTGVVRPLKATTRRESDVCGIRLDGSDADEPHPARAHRLQPGDPDGRSRASGVLPPPRRPSGPPVGPGEERAEQAQRPRSCRRLRPGAPPGGAGSGRRARLHRVAGILRRRGSPDLAEPAEAAAREASGHSRFHGGGRPAGGSAGNRGGYHACVPRHGRIGFGRTVRGGRGCGRGVAHDGGRSGRRGARRALVQPLRASDERDAHRGRELRSRDPFRRDARAGQVRSPGVGPQPAAEVPSRSSPWPEWINPRDAEEESCSRSCFRATTRA